MYRCHGWQDSIVCRYIDNPYSPEALAEPRKDWLEIAPLDVTGFPKPPPITLPIRPIKRSGEDFTVEEQPPEYVGAHLIFMSAAKRLLGTSYMQSRVFFDHFSSHLYPGQVHTFAHPHIDGTMPGGVNAEQISTTGSSDLQLKLIGTAVNEVPTVVLHGAAEASDFEGETLTHMKPEALARKDFKRESLPLNVLNIMAPSTIHYAQPADCEVDIRNFLRWQAFA